MGAPFLRRFTLKKETVLSAFRLTAGEFALWAVSAALIVVSFLVFDGSGYLTLAALLVGVTSLIFCARGNPLGLALMVVFSLLYGLISLGFRYYGEMLTYLGMTMPMSVYSLVVWLRHPYAGSRTQVAVRRTRPRDWLVMGVLAAAVTAAFFFILRALNTANLVLSTVSVTTRFAAVYLTGRRSPYYALAYAANDGVLIALWLLAAAEDPAYFSVAVCFAAFLINDLYGFLCWRRMARRQGVHR